MTNSAAYSPDRRAALQMIAGGVATLACPGARASDPRSSRPIALFGSAVNPRLLEEDPVYCAVLQRHCRIVVPEGGLKWAGLRPTSDEFRFGYGDAIATFAQQNGMAMRGHTLVWHMAMPDWTAALQSPRAVSEAMKFHIDNVVGRYAGRIASWDVVNEPLPEDPGPPSDRRDTLWHRHLGESYIAIALRLAATAGERLAEFGRRRVRPRTYRRALRPEARRDARPRRESPQVQRAAARDGLQAHLRGERTIDRVALRGSSGAARYGSENPRHQLDVIDWSLPRDVETRDRLVADRAEEFLETVFDACTPGAVLTWGLTDRHASHSRSLQAAGRVADQAAATRR